MPCLEPALGERQPAQSFNLLRREALRRHQNVETFAHAGRRYQVLELQGDLGALLGQAAVFEGVGKLIASLRFPSGIVTGSEAAAPACRSLPLPPRER